MTDNPSENIESPPKKGLSTAAKVGIGCAATFVLLIVIVCGGGLYLFNSLWTPYSEFGDEFEQQGYTRMEGSGIDLQANISGPHVIVGRGVNIEAEVDGDLAVAAWGANIDGVVNGDLDFYGWALNIGPRAHIKGNIRIREANAVNIDGIVDGEITGTWNAFQDNRRQGPPTPQPEPADAPEDDPESP